MQELNIPVLRLQYEILNIPIAHLASKMGIPVSMLVQEADEGHWAQWWPEENAIEHLRNQQEASEKDLLTQQSDEYLERSKKRLRVYAAAKEIYLAAAYLQLEDSLISRARELIDTCALDASAVKQLSAIYKDLTSKSPLSNIFMDADEESGIPSLIIRDLSGS